MKDIIRDRLNKMEDLEQRRMLKDLMTGVFLNLVEYQETLNKQIEQRVFDEVKNQEGKYELHITLIDREDYDPIHEFLRPMLSSDLNNQVLDISGVAELVRNGGKFLYSPCFWKWVPSRFGSYFQVNGYLRAP